MGLSAPRVAEAGIAVVWDCRSHPEAAKSDSTADREPSLQYANEFFYGCEELLVITFYSWYLGYNSSSVVVPLSKK